MTARRLFHFSDDPAVEAFVPRPVRVPSTREAGRDWLNGPLVWAVAEHRQVTYLFPRDCPRILVWPTPATTAADLDRWWPAREPCTIVHVEWAWLDRLRGATIHRYELPGETFEPVDGDWQWVTRAAVTPMAVEALGDLLGEMGRAGAELRLVDSLVPLRDVWSTTVHTSGIRLRNAAGWPAG